MRYWVQGFDDGGDPVAAPAIPSTHTRWPSRTTSRATRRTCPARPPPRAAAEDTECPPGLPGCAPEEETKGGETEAPEEAAEKPAPGAYVHWWFGLSGALDFLSMPAGNNVCLLNQQAQPANSQGYYCTESRWLGLPGAQRRRRRAERPARQGRAGRQRGGGLQPGNVRIMFAFDYALSPSFLLGARFGYVANAYTGQAAVKDGHAFSADIDFEARATYLFGDRPLANVGFAPDGLPRRRRVEFDGHTTTIVTLVSQQPANAWITDGPFFVDFGGGARYAFSPRAAFNLALRVNAAVGNGFLATYGPEVGIQYGF